MQSGFQNQKNKIDLQLLQRTIDVKLVLEKLGIPFKKRLEGLEIMLRCVNPGHEDKSGDSLHMNARGDEWNGRFNCNPCGMKGDFIKYLQLSTTNSFVEIINYLKNFGKVSSLTTIDEIIRDRESIFENQSIDAQEEFEEIQINYQKFPLYRSWDESHPALKYMADRRIHPSIAFNHEVGWSGSFEYKPGIFARNAIVFPIRKSGKLVSYFLRCFTGCFFGDIKKLFPVNAPVGKTLYNIDSCDSKNPTIVVEGIIDAHVVLSSLLLYGVKINVVSAYSNNATEHHIRQLEKIGSDIIVMPDRDGEPGAVLPDRIGKALVHKRKVYIANIPWGKDPGDCTPVDIMSAIEKKELWCEHIARNQFETGRPYSFN